MRRRHIINQDALVAYLQQAKKDAEESELHCAEGARYEYAQKFRERKFIYGDLLIKIAGSKFDEPFKIDDGGFMEEVEEEEDE